MSCQTERLPFGTGTLWKLIADSVYRRVLASPVKLCGDSRCILKQLFTTALCVLRCYPAAFLGDHVANRGDGSFIEGGLCRSFQIRPVLCHITLAPIGQ